MTRMKPLSEIAYVPNAFVHSMGSDSDGILEPPDDGRRRGAWRGGCRPSPWWALGGLLAIVVVLIAVVLTVELYATPSERETDLANGVILSTLREDPPATTTTAPSSPSASASASASAQVATSAPLGITDTATITVAARSARVALSNVIRHALGTYAVDVLVGPPRAYEEYAAALGSRVVLRLHGEMMGLTVAVGGVAAVAAVAAAADLLETLDPEHLTVGGDAANLTACLPADELVHGVYVRTVCVDGVATPHARHPALRCYVVLEAACFAPGRSLLPPATQHDVHNGPWVFSYTSTSTYVRRARVR